MAPASVVSFSLDPVMSGLLAFMAFLLVAAPYADGKISTQYLSGQGIFTALITAIYSTRVYAWLKQNNITIRLPERGPPPASPVRLKS